MSAQDIINVIKVEVADYTATYDYTGRVIVAIGDIVFYNSALYKVLEASAHYNLAETPNASRGGVTPYVLCERVPIIDEKPVYEKVWVFAWDLEAASQDQIDSVATLDEIRIGTVVTP